MAPSLSSVERSNPPPRRKSCLACIKAKRRCDLGTPACQRCRQRSFQCTYPPGSGPRGRQTLSPAASPAPPATTLDFSLDDALPPSLSCQDYPVLGDSMSLAVDSSLPLLDSFLETPEGDESERLFGIFRPSSFDFATPLEVSPPMKTHMFGPSDVNSPESKALFAWAVKTRLQYTIDKIAATPRQMVEQSQMPWCHRHLYRDEMPRSMQDAISSAALYMAKNEANAELIHQCVEARVQDLLSSPMPTSPRDILARAHALLIYQILRVFDSDVRTRAAAETMTPQLESTAFSLMSHIIFDDATPNGNPRTIETLPLYPVSTARDFWHTWIFQESARRTFLITFFFLQTYRTMKGVGPMQCDGKLYLCHSWTMSAHLWHADDPVNFAIAWRDKKHFIISNSSMREAIEDAKADDIDLFGKLLITALLGIDETRGWLAMRGGSL